MPQSKKNVPIRGLNWMLTFGKYSGLTILQVLQKDAQYIEWCVNERIFVLNEEADEKLLEYLNEVDIEQDWVKDPDSGW